MSDKEIFYYEVDYKYDETINGITEYKSRTQYGFIYAEDYRAAAKIIEDYFADDLEKMTLESIGYIDLLGIHDEELAKKFKEKFLSEF